MTIAKSLLLIFALVLIIASVWLLPDGFISLENLKAQQALLEQYYQTHPIFTPVLYVVIYILTTALSLPGATILTLCGGALFGFSFGSILVSIASTLGATLAFLLSRTLFYDAVTKKFGDKLNTINENLDKSGSYYLFSLRLVPVVPFFVINAVMALTPIKTLTFAWVSWLGMLAGTLVYVNAGTQLAQIQSINDILSPPLILSFVLLAVFPYLARSLLSRLNLNNA